jgi:hypothetical protein
MTRSAFFAALEERKLTKAKKEVGIVFTGIRKVRQSTHAVAEFMPSAVAVQAVADGPSLEGV